MLECKGLYKKYVLEKKSESVDAISGISLSFPKAGMVFVLGKSGSGKSTLLNLLGGLDKPSNGSILVNGRDITLFTQRELDFYRNSFVGFVFQDFALIDELNVSQNIAFALELQSVKVSETDVSRALASVGLEGYGKRRISSLSGGQKQRVAIARAMIKDPSLILADEPTGALDFETGNSILAEMKRLSKTKLVIVVSHDREAAERYADRIIELKDGKIIDDRTLNGTQAEVIEEDTLTLKKSRLPIHKGFLIGLSSAFKKPFRLLSSVLLTATALSFFGVFSTLMLYDEIRNRRDVALQMHADSGLFSKSISYKTELHKYNYANDKEIGVEEYTEFSDCPISKEEIAAMNSDSKTGLDYAGVYRTNDCAFEVLVNTDYVVPLSTKRHSCPFFSGFTDFGLEYLERNGMAMFAGSYPSSSNEIAISKYHAELILDYYLELENTAGSYDYSRVIGSDIRMSFGDYGYDYADTIFKVSGIIDTGRLNSFYADQIAADYNPNNVDFLDDFTDYMRGTFHCLGFVSSDFYDKFSEAFSSTLFNNVEGLSRPWGVYFLGLKLGNETALPDDRFPALLPRLTNTDLYTFYKPDGSPKDFVEPKDNEIYIDYLGERSDYYAKLQDSLLWFSMLIQEASDECLLPEFSLGAQAEKNKRALDSCFALAKIKDPIRFGELLENGLLPEDVAYLSDSFYEKAFQRYYIRSLVVEMVSVNISGNLYLDDLTSSSEFYQRTLEPILYPDVEYDESAFSRCYEHIKNDSELLSVATNILHLTACDPWRVGGRLSELWQTIWHRLHNDGNGYVGERTWSEFNRLFLEECQGRTSFDFHGYPCSFNNIVSFDITCESISFDAKYECPEELTFTNTSGIKGKFKVIGMHAYKYANRYQRSSYSYYFVNESFLNKIAKSPETVDYWIAKTEYKGSLDGKYNFVITKGNFSLDQVREMCKKGRGYEYRLVTKNADYVDSFLFYFKPAANGIVAISLILGVFAAALLATFISNAINSKRKEIGVIRCLGGRQSDIFMIFIGESLVVAMASGLLASVLAAIECLILNNFSMAHFVPVAIFYFGIANVLIVLAVALLFSFLATFIPILRRGSISPYEALRTE